MNWLHAARKVLEESDRPLTSHEIADRAIRSGFKSSTGEHSHYSVQAAIAKDIKQKGQDSTFIVLGRGNDIRRYGIRAKHEDMRLEVSLRQACMRLSP